MTALVWDKVGVRRFETGIDHGVLYLPNGSAVPWNGLLGLTETRTRDVKPYYLDGMKYLNHHVSGDYSANITAITYPDELETLIGVAEYAPGVSLYDQRPKLFDLSYRTLIGNDLEEDAGYRIHLLWNLLAVPADVQFASGGGVASPVTFAWSLLSTPSQMLGARPTAHISLDSPRLDPEVLSEIEDVLYGTVGTDPTLPTLIDLLELIPEAVGP